MGIYFCNICSYKTPVKSRFNTHCETAKHKRNGGVTAEKMIKTNSSESYNELWDQIKKLSTKIDNWQETQAAPQPTINIFINGIYFNATLEYYTELVKKMGIDEAHHYLLHSLPQNPFDVLKKIYTEGTLPILRDENGFVICRSETDYEIDLTGDVVNKENKQKIDNAIIMASTVANDPSVRLDKSRKQVNDMAHPKKYIDELDSVPKIIVIPKTHITKIT